MQVKTPRFLAYLGHYKMRTMLVMPRDTWDMFKANMGKPVLIEITDTPLSKLSDDAIVLAATAVELTDNKGKIQIYREDKKDYPNVVNLDEYLVYMDLHKDPNYLQIVASASTEDNENLRNCCKQHVFLIKQNPGPDHWQTEVSETITARST